MTENLSKTDVSEYDAGGDSRDELFDVLSNARRRFLLHSLQTTETAVPVADLTTEIVTWETQRPVPDRSGDDRDAIRVSLVHNHLPMMEDAGFLDYDRTRQTVSLASRTDEVDPHLQPATSD